MAESVFTALYPLVFLIGLSGYLPQLYALITCRTSAESISLLTWFIWTSTWLISLGYGLTKLDDLMFCAVALMNVIGHLTVIILVMYRRGFLTLPAMAVMQPQPVKIKNH